VLKEGQLERDLLSEDQGSGLFGEDKAAAHGVAEKSVQGRVAPQLLSKQETIFKAAGELRLARRSQSTTTGTRPSACRVYLRKASERGQDYKVTDGLP
jgi:hypothetical protein